MKNRGVNEAFTEATRVALKVPNKGRGGGGKGGSGAKGSSGGKKCMVM